MIELARSRTTAIVLLSLSAAIGGCVSYSSTQLSAMPTVDLCELADVQRTNMTADTKRALESELQRRKDNCGNHAAAVAERRQAFLDREMYGKHDDP